jgi:transcriptional regulator with XRE-family HTH domain
MDYYKIKQGLRELLEQNNEKISDRAEARLIKMSQKGYTAMMNNRTMTVKKLEEVASLLNKPITYFFDKEELSIANESSAEYRKCPECEKKQIEIEKIRDERDDIYRRYVECLEELCGKKGNSIKNSA